MKLDYIEFTGIIFISTFLVAASVCFIMGAAVVATHAGIYIVELLSRP